MIDYSQLVQDVIDGKESARKAHKIFMAGHKEIERCLMEIYPYIQSEINGNSKDIDK